MSGEQLVNEIRVSFRGARRVRGILARGEAESRGEAFPNRSLVTRISAYSHAGLSAANVARATASCE